MCSLTVYDEYGNQTGKAQVRRGRPENAAIPNGKADTAEREKERNDGNRI